MNLPGFTMLLQAWMPAMGRVILYGGLAIAGCSLLCRWLPGLSLSHLRWLWRVLYLKLVVLLLVPVAIRWPLLPAPQVSLESTIPWTRVDSASAPLAAGWVTPNDASPAESLAGYGGVLLVRLAEWLLLAWCAGFLIHAWGMLRQCCATRRLLRDSEPVRDLICLREYAELNRDSSFSRIPRLMWHTAVAVPQTAGFLQPMILVPRSVSHEFSASELRMMLAHELAHARHGDLPWRWFRRIVNGLFFFHPLVWIADRAATLAEEMACDASALIGAQAKAVEYAGVLLRVAAAPPQPAAGGAGLLSDGLGTPGRMLARRIEALPRVTSPNGGWRGRMRWGAAFPATLGLAVILPWGLVSWFRAPGIHQIDPRFRVLGYEVSRGRSHALSVERETCQIAGLTLARTVANIGPIAPTTSATALNANGLPSRIGGWLRSLGLHPEISQGGYGLTLDFSSETYVFLVRLANAGDQPRDAEIEALLVDEWGETILLLPHPVAAEGLNERLECWLLSPAPVTRARFDLLLRLATDGQDLARMKIGEL